MVTRPASSSLRVAGLVCSDRGVFAIALFRGARRSGHQQEGQMRALHHLAGDALPSTFPKKTAGGTHEDEIRLHLLGRLTDGCGPVRSLDENRVGFDSA